MTLEERVKCFEILFEALQSTNSRLEKEQEVKIFTSVNPGLISDWNYILETLDGKHPIGWTFTPRYNSLQPRTTHFTDNFSIRELIKMCESCAKDRITTAHAEYQIGIYGEFLAPIVNRTLRLGIGKSLLEKSELTPMLAKKYEGKPLNHFYVVTEKLDGNRCIAAFNKEKNVWEFFSRSGKQMKVNFDMSKFDPTLIYDGEVMSEAQTRLSVERYAAIVNDIDFAAETKDAQLLFNKTSGLINQHRTDKKGLVYNIFDIVDPSSYSGRRDALSKFGPAQSDDVLILPTLYIGHDENVIKSLLGRITQMGGEGIMLNRIDRGYEHKRSDALLKYKQVQFMDMVVVGVYGGMGKYEGLVGGLNCRLYTDDGKTISCDVGSGLSDEQRFAWTNPSAIIGSIVQIGYHELTQSDENIGTNNYSLRFPRLIKVRKDKDTTSEY